jgi:CubicO group peptidase (beta-lactamase class C family)
LKEIGNSGETSPDLHTHQKNSADTYVSDSEVSLARASVGWVGGFGTTAYTDPAEGMIGILFTQRMRDSPESPKVFEDFWTLAYGAM